MTVEDDIRYFKEKILTALQVPAELLSSPRLSVADSLVKRDIRYVFEYFRKMVK
jgi:hypothetical protein